MTTSKLVTLLMITIILLVFTSYEWGKYVLRYKECLEISLARKDKVTELTGRRDRLRSLLAQAGEELEARGYPGPCSCPSEY